MKSCDDDDDERKRESERWRTEKRGERKKGRQPDSDHIVLSPTFTACVFGIKLITGEAGSMEQRAWQKRNVTALTDGIEQRVMKELCH